MTEPAEVVVTTLLRVGVDEAFTAFTAEIDRWWRRDRTPEAIVQFNDARLVAVTPHGAEVLADVVEWVPPQRVDLRWHGPHSRAGDRVIVEFAPHGPDTRVTVRHRREGLDAASADAGILGLWWGDLLSNAARGLA